MVASAGAPHAEPPPEKTAALLPLPPPLPPKIAALPTPPADPIKTTFDNFHASFLNRVATGRQTAFNTCFTRTGNPVLPENVDRIRNGPLVRNASFSETKVDYSLPPIIVLDPGHQSEGDPGAIRQGLRETTVINAVAVKLMSVLEEGGADVVGTRAPLAEGITLTNRYRFKDQDRALQWRAELAYEFATKFPERPVLAISLHADTSEHPGAKGAGIFYYAGSGAHSASSAALARSIAMNYRTPGGSMVKEANFAFPRCQRKSTPAVLIELGFLSNKNDFDFLQGAVYSEERAERIANRITAGIFSFIEQRKREQAPAPHIVVAAADIPVKTF